MVYEYDATKNMPCRVEVVGVGMRLLRRFENGERWSITRGMLTLMMMDFAFEVETC